MGKYSEATLKLKAQQAKEMWAARSDEEREEIAQKQSEGAKRMWAGRTEEERRELGRKISLAKKRAAARRRLEASLG